MKKNAFLWYSLAALIGGASWGLSGTFSQYLFQEKGIISSWLSCARLVGAGAILLLIALLFQREKLFALLRCPKDLLLTFGFAILGVFASNYGYLTAIQHSNSGTATVLQYLGPIIVLFYTCFQERRKPTLLESSAMVCAIAGAFLLATRGDFRSLAISPTALFWGIFSAFGLVFYTLLPVTLTPKYGAVVTIGSAMMMAGIPVSMLFRPWTVPVTVDTGMLLGTFGAIVVGSVFGYYFYVTGVDGVGPAKASLIACVEPVVAALSSVLWLGTALYPTDLVGFVLIVGAVAALTIPDLKKPAGKAAQPDQTETLQN